LIFFEEIELFTFGFLKNLDFQIRQFNHTNETTITHNHVKNAESDDYQWQQSNMACQIYEGAINIRVNEMRSRLAKPPEASNEILMDACKDMESLEMKEIKKFYF
jgi:hypothetical protein